MKHLITTIFILFLVSCKSTKSINNVITPIHGEISFERKNFITNKEMYEKSLASLKDKFGNAMRRQVIKERKDLNQSIDTTFIDELIEISKANLESIAFGNFTDNSIGLTTHKFQDSLIISYTNSNNPISKDYTVINKEKGKYYKLSRGDSLTIYNSNSDYRFKNENNIIIEEYLSDKKIINGFECFKIVLIESENTENSDEEFISLFGEGKTIYELYVTNKIKCRYHPYFNYKSVLGNYYPLEIIERNNLVEGVEVRYSLVKLDIN